MIESTYEDMIKIHEIRNTKEVRSQMFASDKISLEQHKEWWESKSNIDNTQESIFIVKKNNNAIGLIRFWFDSKYNAGNWGMYRDIRLNDKLSGTFMEYAANSLFFNSIHNKTNEIIAEVKEGNRIEKLHLKIGFIVESRSGGWILMRNTLSRFIESEDRFISVLSRLK